MKGLVWYGIKNVKYLGVYLDDQHTWTNPVKNLTMQLGRLRKLVALYNNRIL